MWKPWSLAENVFFCMEGETMKSHCSYRLSRYFDHFVDNKKFVREWKGRVRGRSSGMNGMSLQRNSGAGTYTGTTTVPTLAQVHWKRRRSLGNR